MVSEAIHECAAACPPARAVEDEPCLPSRRQAAKPRGGHRLSVDVTCGGSLTRSSTARDLFASPGVVQAATVPSSSSAISSN